MRQFRAWTILLASVAYVVGGAATAMLARSASSPAGVRGWRLAAWLLSLGVFCAHFLGERRRHWRVLHVAARVALGVALGALMLAALGPVRTHWGEPSRLQLAAFALVAWPLLTGIPAFLVALVGGLVLDRLGVGARPQASRMA